MSCFKSPIRFLQFTSSQAAKALILSISVILVACGGAGGDTPASDASLSIKAEKSQVSASDAPFAVTAQKIGTSQPVVWSLSPGAMGKLDASTGDTVHYVPPATVSAATLEYITATIDYDSGTQHLHLKSTVSVQVQPQKNPNTISIFQYNVKGNGNPSTGGWNVAERRSKQLAIINNYPGALDFITLEQATLDSAGTAWPLLSDLYGKPGWQTIVSHCYQDALQIAYDSERWTVVNSLARVQARPEAIAGFGSCTAVGGNKSRPYNMVLFQRTGSVPVFQVLLVAVHMPHDAPDFIGWDLNSFNNAALLVAGVQSIAQLQQTTRVIMVGDMNEVSDQNNYSVFSALFGSLLASPQLNTCCSDSRSPWQYRYDRVLSNGTQLPVAMIATPPTGIGYPLGYAEEHKPIVATVKF